MRAAVELRDKAQMSAEEAIARAEAVAADARVRADELARQLRERGQEVVERPGYGMASGSFLQRRTGETALQRAKEKAEIAARRAEEAAEELRRLLG